MKKIHQHLTKQATTSNKQKETPLLNKKKTPLVWAVFESSSRMPFHVTPYHTLGLVKHI